MSEPCDLDGDDPYANAIGGSLRIKGLDLKRKKKKKKRKRKREEDDKEEPGYSGTKQSEEDPGIEDAEDAHDDFLTDAERRYQKVMRERASETAKVAVTKTHRQKVEELNSYLDRLTEHNDIPRVSAAGNG